MKVKLPTIPPRGYIVFAHDIVMAAVSFVLALYLREGEFLQYYQTERLIHWTALFAGVAAAVFFLMGLYRGVWRYASLNDLVAVTRSVTVAVVAFTLVLFLWTRLEGLPRSVPVINWFTLMALLGGPRFLYRMFKDRRVGLSLADDGRPRVPVLLVGAGDAAELFIRSLSRPGDANYRVVGILAENPGRVGRRIHGVPVRGVVDDLEAVVQTLRDRGDGPQKLILSDPKVDGAEVRDLVDRAGRLGMTLARLPRLTEFKHGAEDRVEPRPIALEDLLGRPQVPLEREAMSDLIAGRRVLVTGAGGSIGSELVRQIADLGPTEICLVESSEYALYSIDMELAGRRPDLARRALICDVRDRARVEGVFGDFRPDLVFHAAALKHVPLVEENPFEGVLTNVLGTRNVADAARAAGSGTMVLISTDKAVNPTNIMGASKRIAERYCQSLDLAHADGTRFVTVRFGNVLGSTGSVVPLFQRQLAAGGPLTVTHPDITRYFMTIHEAVELILEASAIGTRDPRKEGKIFVLDMGEPVRILDLAKQMIRLAGLEPDTDVAIEITGLRPGEKLFEEIFHGAEPPVPTGFDGLLLAAPRAAQVDEITRGIDALGEACRAGDRARLMALIGEMVPEYHATDTAAAPEASAG